MRKVLMLLWEASRVEEGKGRPSGKQLAMLSRRDVPFNLTNVRQQADVDETTEHKVNFKENIWL